MLTWEEKIGTFRRPFFTAGPHVIEMNGYGEFVVQGKGVPFDRLADAKDYCQSQEDAAAPPVALPAAGDVWGVAGKPETWQLVSRVSDWQVTANGFNGPSSSRHEAWQSWVTSTGAVRIDGEGKHDAQWREELAKFTDLLEYAKSELDAERARVAALEAEVARLRKEHEAVQAERNRLREWKASVSNAIQNIPEFAAGQWGGDKDGWGYHFEVVQYLIRNRDELRTKVGLMEEEAEAGRGTPLKGAAYVRVGRAAGRAEIRERAEKAEKERDELRAAVGRLMEALRGIETRINSVPVVYQKDIDEVRTMAREARLREEGVKS